MTHRESKPSMAEKRPILIRYVAESLNAGGPQRPSSCVIVWNAAIKCPLPPRVDPPIAVDLRRIKMPSEFRSLPIGAEVLAFRKGTWWGAIVIKVDIPSKGRKSGKG
jgi:hypothetical protein